MWTALCGGSPSCTRISSSTSKWTADKSCERTLERKRDTHDDPTSRSHLLPHTSSSVWNRAESLSFHRGAVSDNPFQKSSILHLWLFGYELPDTVLLLRKDGHVSFLASKKKCAFVEPAVKAYHGGKLELLVKQKDNNEGHYDTLAAPNLEKTIGVFLKERDGNQENAGTIVAGWEARLKEANVVDLTHGLSFVLSVKDETELDLLKKSSVLSNKVMKHGCVKRMEEVMDKDATITHQELADYVQGILEDPSKIDLKVDPEQVMSCYHPIVQSGGNYDLRVSAQSNSDVLSPDVITVSLGSRYLNYCSNISRTFLVDPPKKVSETYEILLELQDACLQAMQPGKALKDVYQAAVDFLDDKHPDLVAHLPKTLGFAMGLDFRDSNFLISPKGTAAIKKGMVFSLSLGLQNLELTAADRESTPDKSPVRCWMDHGWL